MPTTIRLAMGLALLGAWGAAHAALPGAPACSKTGPRDAAHPWCVALTFDDGPSVRTTPKVLDILDRKHVTATFFVVGRMAQANAPIIRRMAASGYAVGDHSWSHAWLTRIGPGAVWQQIEKPLATLGREAPGLHVEWFRAPYGAIDKSVAGAVARAGLGLAWWTADDNGWRRPGLAARTRAVLDEAGPGGVILMHDTEPGTVAALPGIIDALRKQGAVFVGLSAMASSPGTVARVEYPHRGWLVLQPATNAGPVAAGGGQVTTLHCDSESESLCSER